MNSAILILALGCGLQTTAAEIRYFPDRSLSDRPDLHEFTVQWYGKHLRAMNEPSLFQASNDPSAQAYRFLWLRSFHAPVAVRLQVHPGGDGTLTVTVLSGAGGYEPGKVKVHRVLPVEASKVAVFLEALETLGFWGLPGPDPSRTGLDGAQWVLEGTRKGAYWVLDRWSPGKGAYRDACLLLLSFSRMEFGDVY